MSKLTDTLKNILKEESNATVLLSESQLEEEIAAMEESMDDMDESCMGKDALKKVVKEEDMIEEGMKLIKTHANGNKTAKVYKDSEWGEFRVKHFTDGKHHVDADYHTDDADDAHGTAQHFLKEGFIAEARSPEMGLDDEGYHMGPVEAHGVRGMKSTRWRKTFKTEKHFADWVDKSGGDIEVHGSRRLHEADDMKHDDDYVMNPSGQDMDDNMNLPSEEDQKKGKVGNSDINKNGMGEFMTPVAAMGTYMREEVGKLVESASVFRLDRTAVAPLFEGQENLSEDFVNKAAEMFESAVSAKVKEIGSALVESAANASISLYEEKIGTMVEALDMFTEEVASEWLAENEIAIQSSLRAELSESFMEELKKVFLEHYIDVPENRVNIVESLQQRAVRLEESASSEIEKGLKVKKQLNEAQKEIAILKNSRGLTELQIDKLKSLSEGIKFTTEEDFNAKLKPLIESVSVTQPAASTMILEDGIDMAKAQPAEPLVEEAKPMSMVEYAVQQARLHKSNV